MDTWAAGALAPADRWGEAAIMPRHFYQVTRAANFGVAGQNIWGRGCWPEVTTNLWARQAARVSGSVNAAGSDQGPH
jgi:hypothetical protein